MGGRDPEELPPLRLRRDGAGDDPAPSPALRLRPLSQLSLVLLGFGRDAAVAGLRQRHQWLHAAVGPYRPIRHAGQRRMARLAADFQRHVDPQLHHSGRGQRPPVLAAVVPAHRLAARGARAAVGAYATRAARENVAAAAGRARSDPRAARAVVGQTGRVRPSGGPRHRAHGVSVRLVLPAGLSADLSLVARPSVGVRRRFDRIVRAPAVVAAEARRQRRAPSVGAPGQPDHPGARR